MLFSFTVSNFLSFKQANTLSLIPDGLKDYEQNLHIPYFYDHRERLLKSVAIYGHNSYGKSNLIKSFHFFQKLIFSSFTTGQYSDKIDRPFFRLDKIMATKPTLFEAVFLIGKTKYRYKVIFSEDQIYKEELQYAEVGVRENFLFKRIEENITVSKSWNRESQNKISSATAFSKPHIFFLSVLISQQGIPRIKEIAQWFTKNLVVPDDYLQELTKARTIYTDPYYKSLILKFIRKADLGFSTIFDKLDSMNRTNTSIDRELLNTWFEKEIKNFDIYTNHDLYENEKHVGSVEFELLKDESAGSVKYFILVCLLAYAIKNSCIIWIDELDARFDSSLLEMLIVAFHNPEINSINSQLIFSTHNTILLDRKMRRDQMYIVEKDEYGASTLKKLHSAGKPIRTGKSIEKDFRNGDMGGKSPRLKNPGLFD